MSKTFGLINPLSAKPQKWSNNCLSVLTYFGGWCLGLTGGKHPFMSFRNLKPRENKC